MVLLAGIEEAGRGPVLGDLVIAIVAVEEEKEQELADLGVKDSKELSPEKREKLFEKIQEKCRYEITSVTPQEIDEAIKSPSSDLNRLTAKKMAELINKVKPDKVIVDSPSSNTEVFEQQLKKYLSLAVELDVKNKADRDHTIVGAASILAKVTRDRAVKKLEKKHDIEIGSGYPSDKITQKFLEENWDKYDFFRKSWLTWQKMAEEDEQRGLDDF